MKNNEKDDQRDRGTTSEKPISLHPVPFEEAVADLLKVKPEPKKEMTKGSRRRDGGSRKEGSRKSQRETPE